MQLMTIRTYNGFDNDNALRTLISEYMSTLPFAIDYQNPEQELSDLGALYSEPGGGALFVAEENGMLAGCVALKDLGEGRCEMKRLYVREQFRGRNVGRCLAETIVQRGKEMGYRFMYLDTHREAQKAAIAMYMKMGFTECADYHPNPGKLLCLELDLAAYDTTQLSGAFFRTDP
jgi:ribosomal protein S18 acetylase RimI-like enzyme